MHRLLDVIAANLDQNDLLHYSLATSTSTTWIQAGHSKRPAPLRGHDSEERDKRADKNMKGFQLRRRSSSHMENLDQTSKRSPHRPGFEGAHREIERAAACPYIIYLFINFVSQFNGTLALAGEMAHREGICAAANLRILNQQQQQKKSGNQHRLPKDPQVLAQDPVINAVTRKQWVVP